jgi:hypothetical protein
MLTASGVNAVTVRFSGSLTASWPGGRVTDWAPVNVTGTGALTPPSASLRPTVTFP